MQEVLCYEGKDYTNSRRWRCSKLVALHATHPTRERDVASTSRKRTRQVKHRTHFFKTYNKALLNELKYCHKPTGNTFDLDALMRDFENFKKTLK